MAGRKPLIKRIKWPGWVVLLLIAGLIGTGMVKWLTPVSGKSSSAPYLYFQEETEEADTYTLSISTASMEEDEQNEEIQAWIEQEKESFFNKVEKYVGELGGGRRAHLTIEVDAHQGRGDTYSFIFRSHKRVEEKQSESKVRVFTLNKENQSVKLTSLLDNPEAVRGIQEGVEQQLKKESPDGEALADIINRPDEWNWSIRGKNLTAYFNPEDLGIDREDFVQVNIPLERILSFKDSGQKVVALTFDDGPNRNVTPEVLDILKHHNAKATFFMMGEQVDKSPDLAKRVADEGHEIGNHTDQHKDLTKMGMPAVKNEMQASRNKIIEVTGQQPSVFRPPYGAVNETVEEAARHFGSSVVLWSVDSHDWKSRDPEAVNKVIEKEVVPGSIVLLHDVHKETAEALPTLLDYLEKEGYQFVTVSELLSIQG
ncbi:polysaccharide deacetylase family protein [Halobacillus kuroshimensis]|uniref:Polysaccharide deacetylase family protein n=1 Tax=Halobacillus kuroshimensis TaxID=302481 RepID=A0ABS3DRZ8_9BACI|nr:polysaccharide deacetylase family protein [Halobacillus kuroshimensis]MBN8234081.1 polysaccharide deacetylase family protein [Halobacillus kuroshimensis]